MGEVSVDEGALQETQRAFDSVASEYDRSTAGNRALDAMRQRTLAALTRHLPAGSRLLELGCGPGRDAVSLARLGYRITAIDWSSAMVREARDRVARAGLERLVDVRHLGIHDLDRLEADPFDGVYSDLDPFNCVPDLDGVAGLVAARLRPGGTLVTSVIGRVCPWEIALYSLRRNWPRVRVRFARGLVAVPLNGRRVWMRYYTPAAFTRAFAAAGFTRVSLRTLGLFVPPPYMQAFADRHPALVASLQRLEDRVGAAPGLRSWGDHFLMVLRKS